MGFSFRRSSSFGPFRFNFSKSGIGASVGVKGARVTLSPKGKAYITVGAGGFSYRQNLSSSESAPTNQARFRPVPDAESLGEIKTADVEELRESSKNELVESLNKRAQMFNPAVIVFVLSAICGCIGIVELGSAVPSVPSALPDASVLSDGSRQTNHTDEYALLLARYGQPSTVEIAQAGTASLRTAIWEGARLAVAFVPAGCVNAYGVVTASTSGGLNLILHTSNMDAASSFSTGFKGFQNAYTHGIVAELPPSSNTNDSNAHSANGYTCPANIVHALTVLGLTPGATSEQVGFAFRHMAQMYHPDKTVGLGPELQKLADERMKEINAAHQTVKRFFENA